MIGSGIRITEHAGTIAVRVGEEELSITYPRAGTLLAALVVLVGGIGLWLAQLPADPRDEWMECALCLLLAAPGLWGLRRALAVRPLLLVRGSELLVKFGPAYLEHLVARFPLENLEVQVDERSIEGVRVDAGVVSKRILKAVSVPARSPAKSQLPLHVLEVRTRGQEDWLGVLGSRVVSEVENARLALQAAVAMAVAVVAEDAGPDAADTPVTS